MARTVRQQIQQTHQTKQNQQAQQTAKYTGARKRIRLWMVFMVVFLAWGVYTLIQQTVDVADQRAQLEEGRSVHQKTTETLKNLEQDVAMLNDNEYIGQIARKYYNMFPPGEVPINKMDTNSGE